MYQLTAYEFASKTPPFRPLSKYPFPLPPANTWALITASPPEHNNTT